MLLVFLRLLAQVRTAIFKTPAAGNRTGINILTKSAQSTTNASQAIASAGTDKDATSAAAFQIPEVYIDGSVEVTQADDENDEGMPPIEFSKGKDSDDDDIPPLI
ncbi:hypothetical protein C8J57DRAFT_1727253 [Mycena rebaudengoi]|nr:hypothetical protein C8J57DRAFT_1727559 [Mycena rebaudengoi]KAJ7239874.1 hypothetical protein C8J57DRAFT_1727253 [Mycena rebaudengoi]